NVPAKKTTRGGGAHEHIFWKIPPQRFSACFGFEKEGVPADIEMKTLVTHGAGNTPDIGRIGFQNENVDVVFRKQIAGRKTCGTCTDYDDLCVHLLLRDPVTTGEIPDVPALYA